MKTILIATDFSESASNAADYAVKLAKQYNFNIILLYVFHIPVVATEAPVVVMSMDELEKINMSSLKEYEKQLRAKHQLNSAIECIVRPGFVNDEISEIVKERSVDLVVMGITGAGKFKELLIGSNTTKVVRNIDCPTLIVPENASYNGINTIAFACDFEETKEQTLHQLKSFIEIANSKLLVLNVVDPSKEIQDEKLSGIKLDIFENVAHSIHFQEDGDLVHAINKFIDENKVDILIMIPHKHNVFERIFNQSNTKKMVFHSHVPILAIHD
jgi:nucleotide-binding universal stress UspA family protein